MEANLSYLRLEILAYELDPAHKITQHHIQLRTACVIKFGSESVREVVASVCLELLEERQCLFATNANRQSLPKVENERKKSTSRRAKTAKEKKTSTTTRLGHRGLRQSR